MPTPLNILIAEDSPDDAELMIAQLRQHGYAPRWTRVQTEKEFLAELAKRPDLVLSDYAMPQFSGLRAAHLTSASGLNVPFILVSGTVGEDAAVEAMRLGATDYLLKDRIARLGSAVERALEQKKFRDERKHTEEELRWKTALLEAQLEASIDGILVVHSGHKKVLQNRRMNELWKIPQHIIEDKDDAAQVVFCTNRTKDPKAFTDKVAYLYAHPDETSRDEIELVDGTILDRYSAPVRDTTGKLYGRIWSFRDITENRKLEAQFRQAQKMEAVGQLAGGVAHDFNNILAVIQMHAHLLKEEESLAVIRLDYAPEIEKAAIRATNLTRQLLLFSRRQAMQFKHHDLNEIVANINKMLGRILGEDVVMEYKYNAAPLYIHADSGMLDQVLLNLAVNARDAMPDGGRLIIQTSAVELDAAAAAQLPQARPGAFACLSVSDNGCGIPPEIMSRIFEPFFTTKGVGKGTGLGLATVFGIVQQHHGWINIYSEVNQGTTFRVFLPREIKPSLDPAVRPTPAPAAGGSETILLAEDDTALRTAVRKALTRFGYRVLEADSGVKALEIWRQNRNEIKLLITDMVMPDGMNGKELARRLLLENPRLKIIYTTGYSTDFADDDFHLQADIHFLAKPFDVTKLVQTVADVLAQWNKT
jgi:signal transduction histidine kinase/CheY-like chemotaxis protein